MFVLCFVLFIGNSPVEMCFMKSVNLHLKATYTNKSALAYHAIFKIFMPFAMFLNLTLPPVVDEHVLLFVQFLVCNDLSCASILNYLSALRFKFQWFGWSVQPLNSYRLSLLLKSIKNNIRRLPKLKGVFDISTLVAICKECDLQPFGHVYKFMFLLAFVAFFRLSKLVPTLSKDFDITKHLCRGDFLCDESGATVLVKWSKTLQSFRQWTLIRVPLLAPSPSCPIQAFHTTSSNIPPSPNHSLFALPLDLSPPSQANVRKFWAKILSRLDLDPSTHTFHCFRRSGTSFAFNNNIPLQSIKIYGTWTSDTVHRYISSDFSQTASVASTFQRLLHPT